MKSLHATASNNTLKNSLPTLPLKTLRSIVIEGMINHYKMGIMVNDHNTDNFWRVLCLARVNTNYFINRYYNICDYLNLETYSFQTKNNWIALILCLITVKNEEISKPTFDINELSIIIDEMTHLEADVFVEDHSLFFAGLDIFENGSPYTFNPMLPPTEKEVYPNTLCQAKKFEDRFYISGSCDFWTREQGNQVLNTRTKEMRYLDPTHPVLICS